MSENNMDSKQSRTSILKLKKCVSESNDSTTDYREVRRVSFASSNFIKPFAADPEKNTIWDNTYEEEVLVDSTRSNDHEILDMTLEVTAFKECDKENYIPINPFNDSDFKNKSLFLEANVTSNSEQDMEFTNVLPNFVVANKMQMENTSRKLEDKKTSEMYSTDNAEKTTNEIEDMQFTCAYQISDNVKCVDLIDNVVEENMELTCPIPLSNNQDTVNNEITHTERDYMKKVALKNSSGDSKFQEKPFDTLQAENFVPTPTTDMEISMQLTCVFPEQNKNKTCLNTNENILQYDMELTCACPRNPQNNNLKNTDQTKSDLNTELNTKVFSTNKVLEYSNKGISQEQTVNDVQDMQLTLSLENIVSDNNNLDTSKSQPSQEMRVYVDVSQEDMDISCSFSDNIKLNPDVLSLKETPSSSFAMILNNSPHSEYLGKKIFSTKPSPSTSKIDVVSDINPEVKDKTQLSTNIHQTGTQNFLTESSKGTISSQNNYPTSDTHPHSNISTKIEFEEESCGQRNEHDCTSTNKTNLVDTITVEFPSTPKYVNDIYSVDDTSPPQFQECDEESKGSEQLCASITSDGDSWESILKQAKDVLGLPKVTFPELSTNLFDKMIETDKKILDLLESLKVPEIDAIDLEEMHKLEFGSAEVDSGNNIREETRLSDIVAPQTLDELVKEAATRCENYWEFVRCENNYYCFHIFYGVVSFKAKVHPDKGVVDEISTYDNMEDDAVPLLRYLSQCLRNKLNKENLMLPLGENFDLLTLLDYVNMCVDEVKRFFVEFNKLVEEYGPTHKLRMNPQFSVVVEVMKIKSIIWWVITLNLSTTNVGSIIHISAMHIYEEVDEKHIQNLGNELIGSNYIRNFILLLEEYVNKVVKQVAARTENEFF
ncbi:uncharacterized protein LOC130903978 isoform X1 [Diorhabda carinulata]|uniref:uncharacterized protein LOC130903978 isoform X1 n=1 Tax=Diorhabda carinulata TaxID=1163345 RepID=UPI0025A2C1E3|nr:uncharacterized protein LOC130903978 isoform X1 [Diorhabda carinulata]